MSAKIIQRYLFVQLFQGTMIVLLALLGIDIFFYLVNELRFIGKGDYSLFTVFTLVILKIPTKSYFLYPWSALLGTLLVLGQLARTSELVVLQTSGLSIGRISFLVFKAMTVITILMFIVGELVAPIAESIVQQKKMMAISSGKAVQIQGGVWVRNRDSFVYIEKSGKENELQQLTAYNFDNDLKLTVAFHALKATQHDNGWLLQDITGTRFYKNRIESFKKSTMDVEHLVDIDILHATTIKHLERVSFSHLLKLIKGRLNNNLDIQDYIFAFWNKVFKPIAALVMVFLAVPCVFGPLRSSSLGGKLLTGVMIGFSFYISNTVLAPMIMVIEMSPFLAASLPSIIFTVIGCWLVKANSKVN